MCLPNGSRYVRGSILSFVVMQWDGFDRVLYYCHTKVENFFGDDGSRMDICMLQSLTSELCYYLRMVKVEAQLDKAGAYLGYY